jgi:hypothetical protein
MNKTWLSAEAVMQVNAAAYTTLIDDFTEHDPDDGDHVVPGELRRFLAQLRVLQSVPFSYFVPDSDLLPAESIRFFYLDRNWTDALVQGALSVGTITTADRAQLETVYPQIRSDVDEAERTVRQPSEEVRLSAAGGTVTGFLLRSRLVSGWPNLHVRAYLRDVVRDDALTTEAESNPERIKVIRMERLAPAVLLVLFDGVPEVVHVEEPRQGLQFGVRIDPQGDQAQRKIHVKKSDGTPLPPIDRFTAANSITVPFRPGAPGVIDMHALRQRIIDKGLPDVGPTVEPFEYAVQMLRFPYRQVFGDPKDLNPEETPSDPKHVKFFDFQEFTVSLSLETITATLAEQLVTNPIIGGQ